MSKIIANFNQFIQEMSNIPEKMRPVIAYNLYIVEDNYGKMPDDPYEANCDGGAVVIYDSFEDVKNFDKLNFVEACHEYDAASEHFDCIMSLILSGNDFGTVFISEKKNLDDVVDGMQSIFVKPFTFEDEDIKNFNDGVVEGSSIKMYNDAWERFKKEYNFEG